jgi:hypothetical protein
VVFGFGGTPQKQGAERGGGRERQAPPDSRTAGPLQSRFLKKKKWSMMNGVAKSSSIL